MKLLNNLKSSAAKIAGVTGLLLATTGSAFATTQVTMQQFVKNILYTGNGFLTMISIVALIAGVALILKALTEFRAGTNAQATGKHTSAITHLAVGGFMMALFVVTGMIGHTLGDGAGISSDLSGTGQLSGISVAAQT